MRGNWDRSRWPLLGTTVSRFAGEGAEPVGRSSRVVAAATSPLDLVGAWQFGTGGSGSAAMGSDPGGVSVTQAALMPAYLVADWGVAGAVHA